LQKDEPGNSATTPNGNDSNSNAKLANKDGDGSPKTIDAETKDKKAV